MVRSLFARFGRDRSGVAFIIFALTAAVIIPLAGGALDYGRALTVREQLAAAADAAALAITGAGITEQDRAQTFATAFLNSNYPTVMRSIDNVDIVIPTLTNEQARVEVTAKVKADFLVLFGIQNLPVTVIAEAARGARNLDVVMVVQNSNGMNVGIDRIKEAAKRFRELVLNDSVSGFVRIGLVPYAASVNVGKDAAYDWLDRNGASNLNAENINLSTHSSLFGLYQVIAGANPAPANDPASVSDSDIAPHPHRGNAWGGCLRARTSLKLNSPSDAADNEHDIQDSPASIERWVPLLAPDGYVDPRSQSITRQDGTKDTLIRELANTEVFDRLFPAGTYPRIIENADDWVALYTGRRVDKRWREVDSSGNPIGSEISSVPSDSDLRAEYNDLRRASNDYLLGGKPPGIDVLDLESRYRAANLKSNPGQYKSVNLATTPTRQLAWFRRPGPNRGCVAAPIQTLTSIPHTVDAAVDKMIVGGNPITTVGLAWGWRVISPGAPFNQEQEENNADRVIILFSNGSHHPGNSYSAYGATIGGIHLTGNHLSDDDPKKNRDLNKRTATLCTRIKADGIRIYTVNFAKPDESEEDLKDHDLLKTCASQTCGSGNKACNFASDADTIKSALENIARDVRRQTRLVY
ncbi:MAG: TadE/TadG family type IV pilus assembly protein [Hyphomicrobiaceae bacterium]